MSQIGIYWCSLHGRHPLLLREIPRSMFFGKGHLKVFCWRVRIPTKSAADSERMRPPLGAERRTLSNVTQLWPTSGFFASRLRIDSPFKVIL